jgi:neutral amino acid transport system permease protein
LGAPEQTGEPRTKQVREEVKKSPTGGKVAGVIQRLSLGSSARSFGLLTLLVALMGLMFASPAFANQGETGAEYSDGISGVIREDGEPLENVRISVEGMGYSAEVLTGPDGRWRIGVPMQGEYIVTLDENTLPEGIAVIEDGASREVTVGSSGRVITNFFLGEGVRETQSVWNQLLSRTISGLNFGLLLGLAAIGLSLVFGTTGLANFAHGEMVTVGAVAVLLFAAAGVPVYLALPLGVIAGGAVGWSLDAGLWRPMRKRGIGIVQVMIVSIGLSLAARFLIQYNIGGATLFLPPLSSERVTFGPVSLGVTDIISMAISLAVLVAFAWWLMNTKTGKATRAISDNSALAAASGIDVERVIRVVWVVAGMLAALGGILWAYYRPGLRWDMGTQILLFIFAAGILGGLGTAFGALIGAIIVGVLIETSAMILPADMKYVGALAVMILILLVRPQGILGRKERIG